MNSIISGWVANTRGCSYVYGEDIVHEMCARLNIDLIARAHQVVQVIETRKETLH